MFPNIDLAVMRCALYNCAVKAENVLNDLYFLQGRTITFFLYLGGCGQTVVILCLPAEPLLGAINQSNIMIL